MADSITADIGRNNPIIADPDYNNLDNKPKINGVELSGNKTNQDLGLAAASDVTAALGTKVDKEAGKGLSANDFSDEYKNKLDNVEAGAEVNVLESVSVNGTPQTISGKNVNITVPTKTSDINNDSNFPVDAEYVHTDNNYTTDEKSKLSGIAAGAQVNVIEAVKLNGTTITPDEHGAVNITPAISDVSGLNDALGAKYVKPSGGITSADLDSAVQASLGKADSAYQKPSEGITESDFTAAIQAAITAATTALQPGDIDSGLSATGKAADAGATGAAIAAVDAKYSTILFRPQTWAEVQAIVRAGKASTIFKAGDQFACKRGNVILIWDVIGIDHDTPADATYTHSMTLQLHDSWTDIIQFCERQAFYYCASGLSAGTYNFTVGAHTWAASEVNKTYQFTLTSDVPEGGQLVFKQNYNATLKNASLDVFSSGTSETPIETVTMTEGSGGTSLGTINNSTITSTMNTMQRALLGSSNYKDSAVRQWLNSSAAAGAVWTPQSVYDRPPVWASTENGWMNGLDADFLAVIGNTSIKTAKNTLCDGGGYDTTSDKFFLLSRENVYADQENSVNEGGVYAYYQTFSDLSAAGTGNDNNRIKQRNSTDKAWFLRTPLYNQGYYVRAINATGGLHQYAANYVNDAIISISFACNII